MTFEEKFLESVRKEINLMRTMPSPKRAKAEDRWESDDRCWFSESIDILEAGFTAGEPTVMFLFARCTEGLCRNGCLGLVSDYLVKSFYPELKYDEALDELQRNIGEVVMALYQKAAKAGSKHAALWVAFCLDCGISPFDKDPDKSSQYAELVGEKLESLELMELSFLETEYLDLVDLAHDADIAEDLYACDNDGYYIDPDPNWRTLHLRSIELAFFMLNFNLTYSSKDAGYDYKWPGNFPDLLSNAISINEQWEKWSIEKGYLLRLKVGQR